MIVTHKITMDLMRPGMERHVNAVQDDKYSRNVEISIFANSVAWTIPEGADVLIRYRKSDGKGGEYNTLPDGTTAWSAEGHILTIALAPQVLTAPGMVTMAVTMYSGEQQISTFDIGIIVRPAVVAGIAESEDYINVITVGTVETLPEGSAPTASITGTSKHMVLNLGLPEVPAGEVDAEEVQQFVEEYLAANPPKAETEQPDWNANEGESGHVLNRTHYAGTVVVGPTFDGDLSGRNYVGMDGTYLVKVSDQIPTVEELTGATVAGNVGGTDSTLTLTADMIQDASAEGFPAIICVYQEIPMVWCAKENLTISEGVDLTPGTWFIYALGQFYVKSLSCLEDNDYTKDILKHLDEKFIPDTIARKTEIPQIPTALPNPNALTIDGVVYDGSAPVTIAIPNADLAQNDPAQKDYVSGRTHWTDDDGTIHKLDNKYIDAEWMATKSLAKVKGEILFPETAHEVMLKFGATGSEIFAPGTTIVVTVNGADYMCDALEMSDGNVFFGNAHTAENDGLGEFAGKTMEDTGEPFYMYGTAEYGYLFTDAVGAYTTSVSAAVEAEIPNKLPEEFLPEGYSKDELVAAVIAALPNAEEVAF